MVANLRHFAIECDDVERAKRFYETALGWSIRPYGPPGFYQAFTGSPERPGIQGALQARREPLTGTGNRGMECTFGVDELAPVLERVVAAGGRITMEPFTIDAVGTLEFCEDTEGNRFGVMQYADDHPVPSEVLRDA